MFVKLVREQNQQRYMSLYECHTVHGTPGDGLDILTIESVSAEPITINIDKAGLPEGGKAHVYFMNDMGDTIDSFTVVNN